MAFLVSFSRGKSAGDTPAATGLVVVCSLIKLRGHRRKLQIPSSKLQGSSKSQAPKGSAPTRVINLQSEICNLKSEIHHPTPCCTTSAVDLTFSGVVS